MVQIKPTLQKLIILDVYVGSGVRADAWIKLSTPFSFFLDPPNEKRISYLYCNEMFRENFPKVVSSNVAQSLRQSVAPGYKLFDFQNCHMKHYQIYHKRCKNLKRTADKAAASLISYELLQQKNTLTLR